MGQTIFFLSLLITYHFIGICGFIKTSKDKTDVQKTSDRLLLISLVNELHVDYNGKFRVYFDEFKTGLVFDPNYDRLFKLKLNTSAEFFSATFLQGKLLIIGGLSKRKYLKKVQAFDLSTGESTFIAPLNIKRQHSDAVTYHDGSSTTVYVIGGWKKDKALSSIETLNSLDGQWKILFGMKHARSLCSVTIFNDKIYIAGGITKRITFVEDIEVYDIKRNSWKVIEPMYEPKHRGALVASDIYLYYAGGLNASMEKIDYMERYDPSDNTWTVMNDSGVTGIVTAVYANKKIYFAGGDLDGVIVYEEHKYNWSELRQNTHGTFVKFLKVPDDIKIKVYD